MTHEQLLAHSGFLQRVARSLVSNEIEADDIVQTTWLSALEAKPGKVRATRAWLKTIALNVVRGERRRDEFKARCPQPPRESALEPADLYLREQATRHLVDAVFDLPTAEQEVVLLRFFDGQKPGEIARHLSIPTETVRTRLRRALDRLRLRLDAEHEGDRATWVVALAPFTGLRPMANTATANVVMPAVALSVGSAKVATLVAVSVIAVATFLFLNLEQSSENEIHSDNELARETVVRKPSRATRGVPIRDQDTPEETAEAATAKETPLEVELTDDNADILCNVMGRAIDEQGNPVAGAHIELCSTNGGTKRIAESYSDEQGYFRFGNHVVPPQSSGKAYGTVLVFGTAPGYGFSWHGMRWMNRGKRPDDRLLDRDDFFRDEECVMNLVFPPARTVEGVVVDENGTPVPDVVASLVSCDFIDKEGKHSHVNFREFQGISYLPEHRRKARSDANGRFRILDCPSEMLLNFRLSRPDRAMRTALVVTTDRDPATLDLKPNIVASTGAVIERSPVKIVMPSARRLTVRCIHPSSKAPVAGAMVHAYRRGADRQSSWGRTNAQGELVLHLPAGDFRVCVDPAADTKLIRTYREINVAEEPHDQELTIELDGAAIVVFEAIDAVTKKPIEGVSFASQIDGVITEIQSSLSIVDHPTTNAEGRLEALMKPGQARIRLGWTRPPGYEPSTETRGINLRAGKTQTVRFELSPSPR